MINKFDSNKVRRPQATFVCFYANKEDVNQKVGAFMQMLDDIRDAAIEEFMLKRGEDLYIEIVHHLGTKVSNSRYDEISISGFDKRYLKKYRPVELEMVRSNTYQQMLKVPGVVHGSYSDMKEV